MGDVGKVARRQDLITCSYNSHGFTNHENTYAYSIHKIPVRDLASGCIAHDSGRLKERVVVAQP